MFSSIEMCNEQCKVLNKFRNLFTAIWLRNVNFVETMLKQEKDGNLKVDEPFAGYTILHLACMDGEYDNVKYLLSKYNLDPNKIAEDGARPIVVATLLIHYGIVRLLLDNGANVNEELSRDVQRKYRDDFKSPEDNEWYGDFASRMTLLTYVVLKGYYRIVDFFIEYNADVRIKSDLNRTLLMCAVENRKDKIVESLINAMNRDDINTRDNDGFTALHYLVKDEFRWRRIIRESAPAFRTPDIMLLLIRAGADINVMIDGDPGTLFVNMVASRNMSYLLPDLLPYCTYSENFKPLFYATETYDNPQSYSNLEPTSIMNICETKLCIIEDLRLRQILGSPVLKEEVLIMENFNKTYPDYVVRSADVRVDGVIASWKKIFITFGSKSISIYDILTMSNSKIIKLAKNQSFCTAIKTASQERTKYMPRIEVRLEETKKRIELLDKVSKFSFYVSKVFYHLPFYCIWYLIDYLPYNDLKNFTNALFLKEDLENNETVLIK